MRSAATLAGLLLLAAAVSTTGLWSGRAWAQDEEKPYHVSADGTVDWYTFSGFRRYHSECHVCHGPDALGSSFAPALADSMKTMTKDQFFEVVVNGRQNVSSGNEKVMPSFGENKNVMCFIDDLYAYLKARADGAIGRGRPKHGPKPQEAKEYEDACMSN